MNQLAFSSQYKYIEIYLQEQFKIYTSNIENLLNNRFNQILNLVSKLENQQSEFKNNENTLIKSIEQVIFKALEKQFMDADSQAERILQLISQQTSNNFQNEISILNDFKPPEINIIGDKISDHQIIDKDYLDNLDKQLIDIQVRMKKIESVNYQSQQSLKISDNSNIINNSRMDQSQLYVTKSGTKIHKEGCESLKKSKFPYYPHVHKNYEKCQICFN